MLRKIAMGLGIFALGACAAKVEDGDKFREPLPTSSDVSLAVPHEGSAATRSTLGLHPATDPGYAKFYAFTRDVTDAVDSVTAVILGSVWWVVHLPPTTVSDHEATWGPGNGDALSPVVWRLRVTEVDTGVFDYELDGRPKASTSEGDYLAVLKGRGYAKTHAEHRNGSFTIDNDAARTLDPARAHDHGTVNIAHHLSSWPATLAVELRPVPAPDWLDITVTHRADAGGAVDLNGLTDIEAVKDGNLEDVVMHSRWIGSGSGRADVQISGGDVATLVKASECWSSSFARTFYSDNVGIEPASGEPASCAFSDPQF